MLHFSTLNIRSRVSANIVFSNLLETISKVNVFKFFLKMLKSWSSSCYCLWIHYCQIFYIRRLIVSDLQYERHMFFWFKRGYNVLRTENCNNDYTTYVFQIWYLNERTNERTIERTNEWLVIFYPSSVTCCMHQNNYFNWPSNSSCNALQSLTIV